LPASGFFEWHVLPDGKTKQPYYITCADQPVFGFAGLWDRSVTAEGSAIESCTIITMPPNALLAEIHNAKQRMPAILQSQDIEAWLAGSPDEAWATLKPYPDDLMHAQKVSTRVNSPKNNDAALLEAV
jgi:putative SOS response-associated peptidase YedK